MSRHLETTSWKQKDMLSQKNGAHGTVYLINGDRYSGEWKDNLRHGKGTHFYKKTGQKYLGEWQNDKREGYGTLSIPDATLGNKVSTEKLVKVYTGGWKNDSKHGHGTYFYPDGSIYEGNWSQNMRQGWGRQTYADGSVYEGEWHHESRHGQGVLLLKNGDRYEGMWFDNEKEGPGTFVYLKKRQCYKGEWIKGQPRCGTLENLSSLPGYPGTLYPIPLLELENPQAVLDSQRDAIYEERAIRLVGLT
jgi:hypothetical protein